MNDTEIQMQEKKIFLFPSEENTMDFMWHLSQCLSLHMDKLS